MEQELAAYNFDYPLVMFTQQTCTCSKSKIQALVKGVKYVQSNNKGAVSLLLTLNTFLTFFLYFYR